jgi:hypothetical protein
MFSKVATTVELLIVPRLLTYGMLMSAIPLCIYSRENTHEEPIT